MLILNRDFFKSFSPSALIALFLVLVACSSVLAVLSYRSLANVSDDYTYYMEFAAKALNPDAGSALSIGPEGTSLLMAGPDGQANMHKGIHFEPMKYITAATYRIFETPFAVYFFYILLFFSPLLYGAWLIRRKEAGIALGVVLIAYALSPAAIMTSLDSLRPVIVLFPACIIFFIALIYERSLSEKVLALNLLLAIREEALLCAALGIGFLFFEERRHYTRHHESTVLAAYWGAWLAVVAGYMTWIKGVYEWRSFATVSRLIAEVLALVNAHRLLAFVVVAVGIVIGGLIIRYRKTWESIAGIGLLFGAFAALLIVGPVIKLTQSLLSTDVLRGRFGMFATTLGCICVLALLNRIQIRNTMLVPVATAIVVLSLIPQIRGADSIPVIANVYRAHLFDSSLVREAQSMIPRSDRIIVDTYSKQAFYDFPHTFVLQYAPAEIQVLDPEKYYPKNTSTLIAALHEGNTNIVIARATMSDIQTLANKAQRRLVVEQENDSWIWYRIENR